MKIAQEGIGGGRRAIIFFEGEKDHPVHDQALLSVPNVIGH